MSVPDNGAGKNGVKTLAFRFTPERHAQLSLIVQLRDSTMQDEVMKAIDAMIEAAKTDPELLQKIEQAQAEIEREARDRRATIAALFEAPAPAAAPAPAPMPEPEKATPAAKPTKATPRGNAAQQ
jgi:lysyl-tRNA synthetase class II